MPNDLGRLITAARERAGYRTVYSLAKAAGVKPNKLSGWEKGEHEPSVSGLEAVFEAAGWEVIVTFAPRNKGPEGE